MDGLQFNGVIAAAANVPSSGEAGTYTAEMFLEDFPQFSRSGTDSRVSLVPEGILGIFIRNANQSILPSRYFETWRYAAGLYVASMGDTSIKYDNEAVTLAMARWGSWNATQYGQQLISMARMIGMGGMYVI